ncbi:related to SEE1 - probable lysine methyltransferase [Ustilago trichophora]|uniref:Protein-lysine N-methyltransferase EFM4 n=1 Tax=Ustilago trichophora TaxID=86804 RepID=A0A5C3DUU8_9BASI|nr:related to SEE1 - probable lysine methyltransferase [Ustilago trichophora]
MSSTSSTAGAASWSVSKPEKKSAIAPEFYQTSPPPHWSNVPKPSSEAASLDVSRRKFKSPWPSAQAHGILGFLRARLFDWDEVPLPPKVAPSADDAILPPVHKPTWTASGASEGSITFTWLGHAICHLQIPIGNGRKITILCDPVLSRRVSPVQWFGPERYTDAPVTVDEIAQATLTEGKSAWPDLLVLSHNHYDHTDYNTIQSLLNPTSTGVKRPHVFCTLGNKSWFQSNFGLTDDEVTECDWWQQSTVSLGGEAVLKVSCVPAQHFSGRGLTDRDRTLWAGWTFHTLSPETKASVYFAGDTGYRSVPRGMSKEKEDTLPSCPAFKEIGEKLGPFDVSLIPIGAYLPRNVMSTVHLAPQDSVLVHRDVKSKKSYGIHWGSFRLTPEDVNEPPKLLVEEAKRAGVDPAEFGVVEIGQSVSIPITSSSAKPGDAIATAEAPASQADNVEDEPLPESKLGTKQHWDEVYAREVTNFAEIGEEGEVWFGEDAVMRMIGFLERYYSETVVGEFSSDQRPPSVLDLGTGNGHLLFEMLESSVELEDVISARYMMGIDYSEASIQLAKSIAEKRGDPCTQVNFSTADLLNPSSVQTLLQYTSTTLNETQPGWDLVCDKGTLDAIALSSQPINDTLPIDLYTTAVRQLTKQGGIFLITSCNFTEQELTTRFTKEGFQVEQVIPTPSFTFGGAKGSTTTSIAFKRV